MIKHDIKRIFVSNGFCLSVLFTCFIMLLITLEKGTWNYSIFEIMEDITYRTEFMLILCFIPLPYAMCFIEDFQHKYIYSQLLRSSLFKYIFSKVIFIFISALGVTCAGIMSFVMFLRLTGHKWLDLDVIRLSMENGAGFQDLELWFLVEQGNNVIFYLLLSIQFGMLGAMLSLAASLISLFIKNRMMILACPVVVVYVLKYYATGILGYNGLNIVGIFLTFENYKYFGNGIYIRSIVISVTCSIILMICIYKRVRRKLCVE